MYVCARAMQAPLTDKVQTVLMSWFNTTEVPLYTIQCKYLVGMVIQEQRLFDFWLSPPTPGFPSCHKKRMEKVQHLLTTSAQKRIFLLTSHWQKLVTRPYLCQGGRNVGPGKAVTSQQQLWKGDSNLLPASLLCNNVKMLSTCVTSSWFLSF